MARSLKIHLLMRQYLNGSRARINPQHIVAHVIGHIHASGAIEPDTVPHAVIGQRDKHLRLAGSGRWSVAGRN